MCVRERERERGLVLSVATDLCGRENRVLVQTEHGVRHYGLIGQEPAAHDLQGATESTRGKTLHKVFCLNSDTLATLRLSGPANEVGGDVEEEEPEPTARRGQVKSKKQTGHQRNRG